MHTVNTVHTVHTSHNAHSKYSTYSTHNTHNAYSTYSIYVPHYDQYNEDQVDDTSCEKEANRVIIHSIDGPIEVLTNEEQRGVEDTLSSDDVHHILESKDVLSFNVPTHHQRCVHHWSGTDRFRIYRLDTGTGPADTRARGGIVTSGDLEANRGVRLEAGRKYSLITTGTDSVLMSWVHGGVKKAAQL